MNECCYVCLVTCEAEAAKVEAGQMCWMHLEPLGTCSCDYVELSTEVIHKDN